MQAENYLITRRIYNKNTLCRKKCEVFSVKPGSTCSIGTTGL